MKQTLYDKRKPYIINAECGGFDYDEVYVKEALNRILDRLKYEDEDPLTIIREEFGKELMKNENNQKQ